MLSLPLAICISLLVSLLTPFFLSTLYMFSPTYPPPPPHSWTRQNHKSVNTLQLFPSFTCPSCVHKYIYIDPIITHTLLFNLSSFEKYYIFIILLGLLLLFFFFKFFLFYFIYLICFRRKILQDHLESARRK